MRHRQTKGAATDMFDLQPPRHISTLRNLVARAGAGEGLASITASCSQRVTRRCLLGVHMLFIAQAPQLLDQYRLSVRPFSTVV